MKLKLDIHPIYNDASKIESSLRQIIAEAIEKRATEVEIIPGKGSGALKKSVLRFLDQSEIKSRYHRLEKDGNNWGRLFIHFRHKREDEVQRTQSIVSTLESPCACCQEQMLFAEPEEGTEFMRLECGACGSPNRVAVRRDRKGRVWTSVELDYQEQQMAL